MRLELKWQKVKNESLFAGVEVANDEMHKNELLLKEQETLINELKSCTKEQQVKIIELESKLKRMAPDGLPEVELFH